MLTQLRFKNFKSWKDTGEIRMAPLTGLFGTNSSGKTAILQFLLMLKQTVESSDRRRILYFGNRDTYVDLGSAFDALHRHDFSRNIDFSLQWKPSKFLSVPRVSLESKRKDSLTEAISFDRLYCFNASISFAELSVRLNEFSYILESYDETVKSLECKAFFPKHSILDHDKINLYSKFGDDVWHYDDLPVDGYPPVRFYGFPSLDTTDWQASIFPNLTVLFEGLFQSISYLGPLREPPQGIYHWSGERPKDVGVRGEYTADCIIAASVDDDSSAGLKIAEWLKKLDLIEEVTIQSIAANRREFEIRVKRKKDSVSVPITGVGFGVSQILPVLTLCYYAPKGSTLIFEQPELHLHPAAQADLADVFVDAIKTRDVQIIVESHSEHLLRRLQLRIAEEKLDKDDTALYFCNMGDDGASNLLPLELDTYGNINNWPDGFFGDEMGDLVAMSKAAMKRQMGETEAI